MTLPAKFVERVLRDLGEAEGKALCDALDTPPPVSVRLNPAKCGTPAGSGGAVFGAVSGAFGVSAGGGGELAAGSFAAVGESIQNGVRPAESGRAGAEVQPELSSRAGTGVDLSSRTETEVQPELPSRADAAGLLQRLGAAERVPWSTDGWYLDARPPFTLDSDFHAGAYYVQEPSSQAVGLLLGGVQTAGCRILDMCAAPGGKTTLYASLAGPDGLVVANEIDRRRAQALADNVRKWGTGNVVVTTCEPQRLGDFEAWFDVVAVDAPCSGEGMFRKDRASRAEWSEGNVRLCAARQDGILREAWRALKPGGTLLYSTCTFNRDEDEGALERLLAWASDGIAASDEIPVDEAWGILCGRVGPFRTYRFYPHRARGEGFFAAVARKAVDAGDRTRVPKVRRTMLAPVDKAAAAELARWVAEPERMRFAEVAGTLYGWYAPQTEAVKTLSGVLPVIYSGVAMGQLFKGRLRPDGALAFFTGLDRGAVPVAELDAERALQYLRRQEISAEGFAEGLNLVCARGRALGFAKRIASRVNNMYPNSLRIIKQ